MIRKFVIVFLAMFVFTWSAQAQYENWVDQTIAEIALEAEMAAATGCRRDLITGCGCTAGSGGSCICSGSGQKRICRCTDSTGSMYCYHCGGSTSNCECSPTRPTNPGSQGCAVVTMSMKDAVAVR